MDQCCPRFIEGVPAPRVKLQAQVHVIECDREILFVKAADGLEFVAGHNKTGRGNRTDPLR